MKICWFLQRSFVRIGHAININLKEKYESTDFCAFAQTTYAKNFINNQKKINYNPILAEDDIHNLYKKEKLDIGFLKQLEKDYGIPNLWPYIAIDRTMMYSILPREYPSDKPMYSHEEMLKILQVKARAVINFLEKEKPDVICFSVIGSLYSMLIYHIAQKMNIKTIVLYPPSVIKNLSPITEDYRRLTWTEEVFEKLEKNLYQSPKKEEAKQVIKEFRENPAPYHSDLLTTKSVPGRFKQLKFILPKNLIKNILWFLHLCFDKNNDHTAEKPFWFLIDRIKRKLRSFRGYTDLYEKPKENEEFCFYALQGEPEFSLYVWGFFRINQIELIRQIARSLPIHFKLYVKEHPSMHGYRTRRYYKELKKIPNLKLIDPKIPGTELVSKSKIVTTIAGTCGWEAVLLKKPVITFGDIFYNKLSTVKHCQYIGDLPKLIKNQLEEKFSAKGGPSSGWEYKEKELENFVSAILEESVKVDLIDLWHKEKDFKKIENDTGIQNLADMLAKKLKIEQKL